MSDVDQGFTINDDSLIIKATKWVVIISNAAVAMLVAATAIMRYVFKTDLYGIDEFIVISAFTLYMSGSVYGAHRGSHITADMLSQYIKNKKLNASLVVFSSFLTVAFSAAFTWLGAKMFIWQIMKQGKTQIWRIPLYIPQGIIFLCLALMTLYFSIWFVRRIKTMRRVFSEPDKTA